MSQVDVGKIAKQFTKGILDGRPSTDMCYIVCSPLVSYLRVCGIECELTEGNIHHCENDLHHFWITLSDGRIIDPTADQFGLLNIWAKKQPSNYKPILSHE